MIYGGVQICESAAAMAKPSGKVFTDDMRAMVEHFDALGLIRDVPAIFKIGDKIFMHPIKFAEFRRKVDTMPRDPWSYR